MKTYKVDLDYESFLFNPNYIEVSSSNYKIIREFEYVFFIVEKEKSIFKNIKSYEPKYLEYLTQLGFTIPRVDTNASNYEYWWGNHHDKKIEQLLNSKLTSAKVAKENNWGFYEGEIVDDLEKVKKHLSKYSAKKKWIIKRPNSFSGIGHYQFDADFVDENILKKILTEEVLLEPFYERVFDIGTTFVVNNGIVERQFMVENFNSSAGGFSGGKGSNDVDKFKKYIHKTYNYSLDELQIITQKIAKYYIALGAKNNIQIDSFVYREDNELKLYPLVEVNYRKTMGLVIQSLADKFKTADLVEWKILKNKEEVLNALDDEWIKLSPEGNHFHSFFKQHIY